MTESAFIFPGQGSQSVGMLSTLMPLYPQIKDTFSKASEKLGYDVWQLISEGPEEKLNQTQFTQPAILTASIALWRIWQEKNEHKPRYLAGHSLGEYSAYVAAGALDFEDAVYLVSKRGEFMQSALAQGEGAMAAVLGLSDDEVKTLCQENAHEDVLSAVNFNAPSQVVIAGNKTAVMRALDALKAQGKRAILLPVSVPSHCALMQPAAEQLRVELEHIVFQTPQTPVITNVDVVAYQNAADIKNALVRQLYSPVRWVESIELIAKHCSLFYECGPGKVLTGLNKRINSELTTYPLETYLKGE